MTTKKRGLGTGLGALFGEEELSAPQTMPLTKIEPRADQPRSVFDDEALQELSESIATHGILQPITVRALDSGYYQIVAGERRWRAARLAGLREVPVRIIDADDRQAQELALVENLQREDLNPLEEARGYRLLMDEYGLTQEAVSQSVGKSRPAVANALRLLTLGDEICAMLESGSLSAGHARALLALEDKALQLQAAEQIVQKGLSVRQTEALVNSLKKAKKAPVKPIEVNEIDYAAELCRSLGQKLNRKVNIVDGRKKGRIVLEYYGADDREALIKSLMNLK